MLSTITRQKLPSTNKSFSVHQKASYRRQMELEMANRLEISAAINKDLECQFYAEAMRLDASPENIYHAAEMLNRETGELFDGYGSLANLASTRLSATYQSQTSRRMAKRILEACKRVQLERGERLRLITLTAPALGLRFTPNNALMAAAFVLFKKRKWFKDNVSGAFFGEEMTVGDFTKYRAHFHTHFHILACSKFINWKELGDVWSDCLEKAAEKHGVSIQFNTAHNRAVVDVREVKSRVRDGRTEISFEAAVREVSKYVTKGSDYAKVPVDQLCEIEHALRGKKMLQSYGKFKDVLRDVKAVEKTKPYLDTKCTTDGDGKKRKPKGEALKARYIRLCEAGKRAEASAELEETAIERRAFRRKQVITKHPQAVFTTLSGKTFGCRQEISKPEAVGCVNVSQAKGAATTMTHRSASGSVTYESQSRPKITYDNAAYEKLKSYRTPNNSRLGDASPFGVPKREFHFTNP